MHGPLPNGSARRRFVVKSAQLQVAGTLGQLHDQYAASGVPIQVSFRDLVPKLGDGNRGTHYLHPYPAKLLAQIPHLLLTSIVAGDRSISVLDPFCGSGTTLLEAALLGFDATGIDVNPLAAMIARAKCRPLRPQQLVDIGAEAVSLARVLPLRDAADPPEWPNLGHWYSRKAIEQLRRLLGAIARVATDTYRDALLLAFSVAARRVSFADPRVPVPVRVDASRATTAALRQRFRAVQDRAEQGEAIAEFSSALQRMAVQFSDLRRRSRAMAVGSVSVRIHDARRDYPSAIRNRGPFDVVVTSPPYVAAQKYVRSSLLSLIWLGLVPSKDLAELESRTIGREHVRRMSSVLLGPSMPAWLHTQISEIATKNPTRAAIATAYANDMASAISQTARCLRPGGRAYFVVADCQVAGQLFPVTRLVAQLASDHGLAQDLHVSDRIANRGLQTSRRADSSVIGAEHVLGFTRQS